MEKFTTLTGIAAPTCETVLALVRARGRSAGGD
jgi:hypothetical protein